ncbi:Dusp2 [Symbiodinium sp. CCMP2592]|nr:Dusp2 [Symbiodinium sp. CCMP2592]
MIQCPSLAKEVYTFGAPAVSRPAMPDKTQEDQCFRGLRTFTENKLPGGGRQVDAASIFDAYAHPIIPTLALDWGQDSYYVPCPGDVTWPKGGASDWGLHSETHYAPRLKEVTIEGKAMAAEEPFAMANKMVTLAYKSYDSVANTKKVPVELLACKVAAAWMQVFMSSQAVLKLTQEKWCVAIAAMGTCHARVQQMPYDPALDKPIIDRIHAQLRQADAYHRPVQQPAKLCDWGLYLGGMQDVTDCKKMQDLGIRGIANVASSVCIYTPRGEVPAGDMRILHIDADDDDWYPLLEKHLCEFEMFIQKAKEDGVKTVVHCKAGQNRSAALCAAYLIHTERMKLMDAIQLLVERRGLVLTNCHFLRELVQLARAEHLLD